MLSKQHDAEVKLILFLRISDQLQNLTTTIQIFSVNKL